MASRTTYKTIGGKAFDVISPNPTGTAGDMIDDNTRSTADNIETLNTAITNATSANTVSTIVKRDASGNFVAEDMYCSNLYATVSVDLGSGNLTMPGGNIVMADGIISGASSISCTTVDVQNGGIVNCSTIDNTNGMTITVQTGDISIVSTGTVQTSDGNSNTINTSDNAGDFVLSSSGAMKLKFQNTNRIEIGNVGIGFFGSDQAAKPSALTVADAGVVDGTYGATEATVINNIRTRLGELETKLQSLGLLS